jgi:hypothetical protein
VTIVGRFADAWEAQVAGLEKRLEAYREEMRNIARTCQYFGETKPLPVGVRLDEAMIGIARRLEAAAHMSEVLTPAQVDELRPANEPKHLEMKTMTWRLIQTIDALVEFARAADGPAQYAVGMIDWDEEESIRFEAARKRVAAWLAAPAEEKDDE